MSFSRQAVVGLILAATALFVVGILLEKGSEDDHHAGSVAYAAEASAEGGETPEEHAAEEGASEAAEAAESGADEAGEVEAGESGEEAHDESDEKVLGIDLESTPFVILAVLGSLLLAAMVWFARSSWMFMLVAAAMLGFAAFDIAEVFHQVDRDEGGIAAIAGLVAVLHLAAGVGSAQLRDDAPAS